MEDVFYNLHLTRRIDPPSILPQTAKHGGKKFHDQLVIWLHLRLTVRRYEFKKCLKGTKRVIIWFSELVHTILNRNQLQAVSLYTSPDVSYSHCGDVAVCILDINQLSLPTFFSVPVSVSVFMALSTVIYGFNCISFHKFSRQLSAFSLCSSGLISTLLVLSTIYIFLWTSPSALIKSFVVDWA